MTNKVESFRRFSQGQRRPNRAQHMRYCGFELKREIHENPDGMRPQKLAMDYLDAISRELGGKFHGVMIDRKTRDGWTYYDLWVKDLPQNTAKNH